MQNFFAQKKKSKWQADTRERYIQIFSSNSTLPKIIKLEVIIASVGEGALEGPTLLSAVMWLDIQLQFYRDLCWIPL